MRVDAKEREEVATQMGRAVSSSGLPQSLFARAIGTSPARMSTYVTGKTMPSAALYLRALRFGNARAAALERRLADPTEIASRVNRTMQNESADGTWALRLLLRTRADLDTALSTDPVAAEAWRRRGAVIEDRRFDVLLQALIANEYEMAGQDAPEWTGEADLESEWIPEDPFRDEDTIREQTPAWLAKRGIFIAQKGLATA